MGREAAGLLACLIAACGAAPPPPAPALETTAAPPSAAPDLPRASDLAPTGLPGMGPYKLLVLVGPESMELEVMGMAYAATTLGWQVTLAAPRLEPLRGRHGLVLPVDAAVSAVIPDRYDALYVPGGAPGDPASLALAERFTADPAHRALVTTAAGLDTLRAHPPFAALAPATRDEGVSLRGAHLTAARTGDIPALAFALEAYARDRWPRPNAADPRR